MDNDRLRLGFLALCGLMVVTMGALIGIGKNGAITTSFVGISSALFGLNIWEWLKTRGGSQ